MELRPAELTPVMRRFEPFENVRVFKYKWFNWFWLGDSKDDAGNYTLLIGPFITKGRARNAWQHPLLVSKEQQALKARRSMLNEWLEEDDYDR